MRFAEVEVGAEYITHRGPARVEEVHPGDPGRSRLAQVTVLYLAGAWRGDRGRIAPRWLLRPATEEDRERVRVIEQNARLRGAVMNALRERGVPAVQRDTGILVTDLEALARALLPEVSG